MKWFVIGGAAGVGALVACVAFCGAFTYSSVCDRCGAVKLTTEWQLPRTEIPVFSRRSIRQTPVSLCLATNGLAPSHTHQWLFVHGAGNGVRCALGNAYQIWNTVESPSVAQLLEALEQYGERGFRDKVLTNLFQETTSQVVRDLPVPTGGFTNAAQLRAWISEESAYSDFDETAAAFLGRSR